MDIDNALRTLRATGRVEVVVLEDGYRVAGTMDGSYCYDHEAGTLEAAVAGALQLVRKRLAEKQQATVASLAAVTGQIADIDRLGGGAS